MMKLIGRTVFPLRLMALAAVLVLSSACCAHHRDVSMKKLSLTVNLDQGLQVSGVAPTMDVDLVGLTDQEHAKAAWTNLSMNDYWQSGNALRADTSSYRHTLKFGGKDTSFTVPSDNPIWEVWHQKGGEVAGRHGAAPRQAFRHRGQFLGTAGLAAGGVPVDGRGHHDNRLRQPDQREPRARPGTAGPLIAATGAPARSPKVQKSHANLLPPSE